MAEGSQNEKAVKAFLAVTGGIEGYFAMGGELLDMAPLLEADEKTLRESGILGIIEEMERRGNAPHTKETLGEEPLLSPQIAREWLLSHHQVREEDGVLVADEGVPHICLAGIAIASGTEERYLTEAYHEASHHRAPLSDDIIIRIARTVFETYRPPEE